MRNQTKDIAKEETVKIDLDSISLDGLLAVPANAWGIVVFAHGSGSSRFSSRNLYVAEYLQSNGMATLLFDLLTKREEEYDDRSGNLRFDISFLTMRLVAATAWLDSQESVRELPVGYFGASTGAAAALSAAAIKPDIVRAVVSRGGRPDLTGPSLKDVKAPTLFIVGGSDTQVLLLNQKAFTSLDSIKEIRVVPGATHLFEETGALERVARLASEWFSKYLAPSDDR
ncbi:MAG TPA: dienelactone hydrolase family protein [Syntrophorhabdaceae bacterium]|nr:dienelactone hydrolase family protein [Syntrophorhabdaceae bacterium]